MFEKYEIDKYMPVNGLLQITLKGAQQNENDLLVNIRYFSLSCCKL